MNPKVKDSWVLILALGGGGDVLSAAMFSESLKERGFRPIVVSVAWERFVKDPLPGPRRPMELAGIERLEDSLYIATKSTAFPSGSITNQAIIGEAFQLSHNFILDPCDGAMALVNGLRAIERRFPGIQAWGIDVGGDILAGKALPTLRSPLADALLLGALLEVFPDARVAVLGLGVDGELPPSIWKRLIAKHLNDGSIVDCFALHRTAILTMASLLDARKVDTEATAMVVRAYQGLHGRFLIRDAGSVVIVDSSTLVGFVYEGERIANSINPLPNLLRETKSLDEASDVVESRGFFSEWRYEREKVKRVGKPYPDADSAWLLEQVNEILHATRARRPRIQFVAERVLAEKLQVSIGSVRRCLAQLQSQGLLSLESPFVKI